MNINASLIREIRMIAQQAMGRSPGRAAGLNLQMSSASLSCSRCLLVKPKDKPRKAVTIYNGNAVCQPHFNANTVIR